MCYEYCVAKCICWKIYYILDCLRDDGAVGMCGSHSAGLTHEIIHDSII